MLVRFTYSKKYHFLKNLKDVTLGLNVEISKQEQIISPKIPKRL